MRPVTAFGKDASLSSMQMENRSKNANFGCCLIHFGSGEEDFASAFRDYGNIYLNGTLRFSQAKNGFLAYGVWVKRRRVSNGSKPARLGPSRPARPHCGSVKGFDAILRLFFLKVPLTVIRLLMSKYHQSPQKAKTGFLRKPPKKSSRCTVLTLIGKTEMPSSQKY